MKRQAVKCTRKIVWNFFDSIKIPTRQHWHPGEAGDHELRLQFERSRRKFHVSFANGRSRPLASLSRYGCVLVGPRNLQAQHALRAICGRIGAESPRTEPARAPVP